MLSLTIGLPKSRSRCGTLTLAREDNEILIDGAPVAGLASSGLAARHMNENRDPVLPYGNVPTGTYRLSGIYASGDGTRLPARQYGPHGVIALTPVSGQGLLAAGAGRGTLLIHGGPAGPNETLRSTAGALRLANADMQALRSLIGSGLELSCLCFIDDDLPGAPVYDDPGCRLTERIDPAVLEAAPILSHIHRPEMSRRNVMRAAGVVFIVPISFVAAIPEPAAALSY